jgi:hypothetical protein
VNCRPGRIPAAQNEAFNHPDVAAIASHVVRGRHASLVRLTKLAILWEIPHTDPLSLVAMSHVPPGLAAHGEAIARHGMRIATDPDLAVVKRRRGAVVERIVWAALKMRDRNLMREQEIQLAQNRWTNRPWSNPKEVVSQRESAFEVVECKRDPNGLDQHDLDELADIRDTATAEGMTPYPTVAVMEAGRSLRAALAGRRGRPPLRTHGALLWVAEDELIELVGGPSTHELRT